MEKIYNFLGIGKRYRKLAYSLFLFLFLATQSHANPRARDFMNPVAFTKAYPFMNNSMRTNLNPGVIPGQQMRGGNTIGTVARAAVGQAGDSRQVVARGTPNAARAAAMPQSMQPMVRNNITASAATAQGIPISDPRRVQQRAPGHGANVARAATAQGGGFQPIAPISAQMPGQDSRQVVSRATGGRGQANQIQGGDRGQNTGLHRAATNLQQNQVVSIPAGRCLTDYMACMDQFCERPNTPWNRCFCSSRWAQIDARYQDAIQNLVYEITQLRATGGPIDRAAMDAYWHARIGQHTGTDVWANLDAALDIDWSTTANRAAGANAFLTGHEFCVQHLRGCAHMSANLRDAYRSAIARDCAVYEGALQRLYTTAQSVVNSFSD
jgi:hypothetical protein